MNINDREAEKCVEEFTGIIYKVMTQLNLPFDQGDGQDYIQIGRIALLNAYIAFGENPYIGDARYRFIAFAKTRIRWKILDSIRKTSKINSHEITLIDERDNIIDNSNVCFVEKYENLLELRVYLNDREWSFIEGIVINNLTPTAWAKTKGIHRSTVYKIRERIAKKIKKYVKDWD